MSSGLFAAWLTRSGLARSLETSPGLFWMVSMMACVPPCKDGGLHIIKMKRLVGRFADEIVHALLINLY